MPTAPVCYAFLFSILLILFFLLLLYRSFFGLCSLFTAFPNAHKLIKLHDNVYIHKNASLVAHDMVNKFLKKIVPDAHFNNVERIGCIEIMDNVYVSTKAIIMPNVRIGRNCLIAAGSVVSSDIPENSIVAGNPARVIGHMDSFIAWRLASENTNPKFRNQHLPDTVAEEQWKHFNQMRDKTREQKAGNPETPDDNALLNPLKKRIIDLLADTMNGVDLTREQTLVDSNILDSLSMMTVIALLEESFSLKIPFSDVTPYNFNCVDHMACMIHRLTQGETAVRAEATPATAEKQAKLLRLDERDANTPVVQRIFNNALRQPNTPALIVNDQIINYGKLADSILSVSSWLRERGIKQGDCVCVQAIHDPACIASYYGIHLTGAVLVPVEKSAPKARILEIAAETDAKLIIALSAEQADIPWVDYDTIHAVMEREHFSEETPVVYPELDWPCDMIFTTGTTGKSKGAVVTHRQLSRYVYVSTKCVEMKENNRHLLTSPLNHVGGMRGPHRMLANGCSIVFLDGMKDLGKFFETIEKYHVNSFFLPPTTIRIILSRAGDYLRRFQSQIDYVYCSSSALLEGDAKMLREILPNTRLYNGYESTETPCVSVYNFNTDHMLSNCVGKPNEGVELAILLEDGTMTKEPDKVGQICIKSDMNIKEYYHEPELTKSVFRGDWFVSNDIGKLDRDGQLFILGREGDVINIGGYKIAPTDVEDAAIRSGMVDECICIVDRDEYDVPYLKLLVVCSEADKFDPKALNTYLADELEAYKVPRKIELTDSIRKTFNGKIDRKAYRK